MAKVSLSALLDSLTGKLSGSVFQFSNGGLQLRSRVSPRDPKTTAQQTTRGQESLHRLSWSLLSVPNQDTWRDNAPVDVPGISFYLATQQKISLTGQAPISEFIASGSFSFNDAAIVDLNPFAFNILLECSTAVLPAATYLNVFATRPFSAGTSFISPNSYRFVQSVPPGTDTTNPIDILATYSSIFGSPIEGSLIGIRAYVINSADGPGSPDQLLSAYTGPPL